MSNPLPPLKIPIFILYLILLFSFPHKTQSNPIENMSNNENQYKNNKNDIIENEKSKFLRYQKILGEKYIIDPVTKTALNIKTNKKYNIVDIFPKNAIDSHGHKPVNHAFIVLFMLLLSSILAQILLSYWKKRFLRSYQITTLILLWILPFFFSLKPFYLRFILFWLLFSFITIFIMSKANKIPISERTPRQVYTWFYYVYQFSCYISLFGYFLVILQFIGLGNSFYPNLYHFGFLILFYGLYFGVLGRDCAEMCADRMAVSMGFSNSESRLLPSFHSNLSFCAICNQKLQNASSSNQKSEKVFKLNCNHQFHDFCIRGWMIIGKKDTCPRCSEKISLRDTFKTPWDKQGIFWSQILNFLRYLIVWNPLILFVTKVVLFYLGYGEDDKMPLTQPMLIPINK